MIFCKSIYCIYHQYYSEIIDLHKLKYVILSVILYLLFNSQSFDPQKDIFTDQISKFDKVDYFATNDTICKDLSNSNLVNHASNSYNRINGFGDLSY